MGNNQFILPLILALLAGLCTLLGSIIALSFKEIKKFHLQFFMGLSAGVMIYVSFVELFSQAISALGFFKANLAFFGGILLVMLCDFLIPHEYLAEQFPGQCCDTKMLKTGLLTTLGIAIHNFPEGVAVFVGSVANIKLGVALALAIALHNLPEGIAVSLPIYCATKSKRKALWLSFLAGIVEPLGALLAIIFLMPFLSPTILYSSFALVAGVMVFISFDELLPVSFCEGKVHQSILGIILGFLLMAISLRPF
ncbi:MAG: zinc transporter ZupT [Candidatus Omnitrophica bacterium]|nr:zinc transporter ZupT [Candidatus Omnitrophota bacterium]